MQLTLHDANLKILGWIDNVAYDTLSYSDDLLTKDLPTGASTYRLKIPKRKIKSDLGTDYLYKALNERAWISFTYRGKVQLFSIRDVIEDRTRIELYCENLNAELLNEYANPYSSSKEQTFAQYCEAMELLHFSFLKIGRNEISNEKLSLEFANRETKLARIIALARAFGAEFEFTVRLNPNSSIKDFTLDVYHGHDDKYHGVGTKRNDLILNYSNGLRNIRRKVSKKNIFNMIVPIGKRSNSTKNKKTVTNNPDGTKTITEKITNENGYVTTVTKVDKTGKVLSKKTVTTVKNNNGTVSKSTSQNTAGSVSTSSTSTVVVTNPDKSTTRTTTTRKSDGTVEKTIVHTKIDKYPDKSTKTTTTTTKPDGSVTERVSWRYANGTSNTTTRVIKPGKSTKSSVVTKVDESDDGEFDLTGMLDWSKKTSDGVLEFCKRGAALYAPISAQLYPSTFTSETGKLDQWTRKDMEFEADSEEELNGKALAELEKYCYPEIVYELDGYIDGDIGDTVIINDTGFDDMLTITARITKQQISFTNPKANKTEIANVRAVNRMLSSGMQNRLNQIIEETKPYTIQVTTDNGVMFKNSTGTSLVTPILVKGVKEYPEATWRFTLNGETTVGLNYLVNANKIEGTQVLTIAAYIGNEEVATHQLTFANVTDGKPGQTGAGVKSVKTLNKLSASNLATKDGAFAEAKPNPTKAEPYVVSYTKTELTDGTTIETPATVTEVRNPEFDDLGKKITDVKTQVDDAKQEHERQVAEIRAQATDAASLASQAQQIGNQAKEDAIAEANRLVASAKQFLDGRLAQQAQQLLTQASAQEQLTRRTTAVEQLANSTKTTLTELSKTVNDQIGQVVSVSERTKTVEDGIAGLTTRYNNLSVGGVNLIDDYSMASYVWSYNKPGRWKIEILDDSSRFSGKKIKATLIEKDTSTPEVNGIYFNLTKGNPVNKYAGEQVTQSVYIRSNRQIDIRWGVYPGSFGPYKASADWTRATKTITALSNHDYSIRFYATKDFSVGDWFEIADLQFELGTIATTPRQSDNRIQQQLAEYHQSASENYAKLSETVQTVDGKIDDANTLIKQTVEDIESFAKKTEVDTLAGRVTDTETQITQNARDITKKMSRTEVENLVDNKGFATTQTVQNLVTETAGSFERQITETKGLIPKSDGINQFALKNIESRAIANPANPNLLMIPIKVQPSTDYTITTNVPRTYNGLYADVFVVNNQNVAPNSNYNGVGDGELFTVTSSQEGMLYISLRSQALLDKIKNGERWIKVERGKSASAWSPALEDLVTETKFHTLQDTVDQHNRLIGNGDSISQAIQSASKFERSIVAGGDIYQAIETVKGLLQEVSGKDGLKTQMTQLHNSWAIKYLTDAGTILSQINLNKDGTVKIDGKLVQITDGTYIKDGVITADKLDVKKLSAIISDLGEITGGTITLSKHHPEDVGYVFVKNIEKGNATYDLAQVEPYTIPAHDTDMLITDNNIIINGPLMKLSKTSPVDSNIVTMLKSKGLHFRMDSGTINREKRDIGIDIYGMLIDGDLDLKIESSGDVEINAQNYSTYLNPSKNIKVVRQGGTMNVWFDVTSNTTGNYYIGNLPEGFKPASVSQELVAEWDTGTIKRIQVDTQGNLTILGANKGKRYCTTLTLIC